MLVIDKDGKAINKKIKLKIAPAIEKKPMAKVRGIIIHQTGGPPLNPHSIVIKRVAQALIS